MNKWIELLAGLILVNVAILVSYFTLGGGFWNFGHAAWEFFKGGLVWMFLMMGALFILLGISDLRE